MLYFSLTLVLQIKSSKIINGMAKVSIKYVKITPFGGIFHVRELFSRFVGPVIDKVLGLRCTSLCILSEYHGNNAAFYRILNNYLYLCSTKVSKKSDMAKSWAARLCRLPQEELFVAQELITKLN